MARPKHRLQQSYADYTNEQINALVKRVSMGRANRDKEDIVNNPPHYTHGGIEAIDYMKAKSTPEEFSGHLRLTAIKYLSRAGLKESTLMDLKKAQWYVNELVEFVEKQTVNSK